MSVRQNIDRQFRGDRGIPVEKLLGRRTRRAIEDAEEVNGVILKKSKEYRPYRPIADFTALTQPRSLTDSQRETLRHILLDPESYWTGSPTYRRFPPNPGFGLVFTGDQSTLTLLIDLHNPGWEFSCDGETRWGFNFAGARLALFAKELFPEYASPNSSIWRKGIIKELERRVASAT